MILLVIAATCCLSLLAAYFIVGPRYSEIRHATVLFTPLLFAAASVLADIFSKEKESITRAVLFASGLIVLLSFAYSITNLYPGSTKRGDWARVGEFITQNERPGQPIVVFPVYEALSLPYYYRGGNRILPDHAYFDHDHLDAEFGTNESKRGEAEFVISQIPADSTEVWLVVGEICTATAACEPLDNFVRANYTIELEQSFYLEKLYLLRKKTQ